MGKFRKNFKRALITGGSGFIGSHLVDRLVEEGLEVTSVDNYYTGKNENLKQHKDNPKVRELFSDIRNFEKWKLKRCFEKSKPDIVFHLAATKNRVCMDDPRRDMDTNCIGTYNVLELSKEFKVKKFIYISTCSVYGVPQYLPIDEKHPINPATFYGVSKLAGERYALVFSRLYDMDVTVLRYSSVYGPRQEDTDVGGVVSVFIKRALDNEPLLVFGDGKQERSFTYVKDVIDATIFVCGKDTKGKIYNVSSGIKIDINKVAAEVLKITGKKADIKHISLPIGEVGTVLTSPVALKELGFEFRITFKEGLKKVWEYYK